MLFNSYVFIFAFIPLVLIGTWVARSAFGPYGAITALVLASLYFYAYESWTLLLLLIGSIIGNYVISGEIIKSAYSKAWMWIGVAANLILLGYFKYYNFFLENVETISGVPINFTRVALPIGISFYTFQQIAWCVDCYQRKNSTRNLASYALFVSFFPQLIAGPIVHHSQIIKQFLSSRFARFTYWGILIGIAIFAVGLFKKKILADSFAAYATPVFVAADQMEVVTFVGAWTAALSYTFQIYFDFSGYSDMAVGLAYMFNVRLPINFYSPYKARSIMDFWRRWHITLTLFLRDYLYIPLGGNRYGLSRRWANLMTTMLLGGLWHGANWTFVFWGALHGFYLVINHGFRHIVARSAGLLAASNALWFGMLAWTITFFAVVVAWVPFRTTTFWGTKTFLLAMVSPGSLTSISEAIVGVDPALWGFLTAGFLLCLACPNTAQIFTRVRATYQYVPAGRAFGVIPIVFTPTLFWFAAAGVVAGIAVFYQAPTTEFLYWQF